MFVGPEDGERGTKGKMIPMEPGDGVIYRGCEVEHWREAFNAPEGAWQTQVFLHYVDKNGHMVIFVNLILDQHLVFHTQRKIWIR